MTNKEIRELAEAHWDYTEQIIMLMLKVAHFLYVAAMIHGYKHRHKEEN